MTKSVGNEKRTARLARWVGYTLLVLALFDTIETFVPLGFMNPAWEFRMVGVLVERVPIPLIGLILVFYGEGHFRSGWEILLLKVLSWVSLLVGMLYLLLIPLALSNTLRLYAQNESQINTQINQRISKIQTVKEQLNKAGEKDIEQLLARINPGRSPDIKNPQDLEKIKGQLSSSIAQAENRAQTEAKAAENQRTTLVKTSLKFNLGALVAGGSFIYIWWLTRWARRFSEQSEQ
jgi:hypothetical protein